MIIIKGKYPDQGIKVCQYKSTEKVIKWFKFEFLENDPIDDEGSGEVIETILTGDPDLELISNWLIKRDLIIDKWE